MGSQTVKHASRPDKYVLNFAATENLLSWPIPNQADGEIYFVEKNNVANYKIENITQDISPTNRYTVIGGLKYQISITKLTDGQDASITFYIRRAEERITSIAVPDLLNLPGDGYLYTLLDNNTIKVRAANKLVTPNYAGVGIFTDNPVLATISLPTNSGLIKWYYLNFYNGETIVWGRLVNLTVPSAAYVCKIKANNTVWDYFDTAENTYSTINSVFNANTRLYPYSIGVDYINGIFGISPYNISGDALGIKINASTLTVDTTTYLTRQKSAYQIYFNPILESFPLTGDVLTKENRYINFLFLNNLTGSSCYSSQLNRCIKANANAYTNFVLYNEFGNYAAQYGCSGSSETGNGIPGNVAINKRNNIALSMSSNQASFALCDFTGNIQFSRRITTFVETALGSRYIAVNERSSQFFTTLSHASHLDKVLIIDPLDANIEVGYFQESTKILCICTNNYY